MLYICEHLLWHKWQIYKRHNNKPKQQAQNPERRKLHVKSDTCIISPWSSLWQQKRKEKNEKNRKISFPQHLQMQHLIRWGRTVSRYYVTMTTTFISVTSSAYKRLCKVCDKVSTYYDREKEAKFFFRWKACFFGKWIGNVTKGNLFV